MVARARVSFGAGGASYRLDGTRRDDDTIASRLRHRGRLDNSTGPGAAGG
jgi:hypothetical protein